MERTARLAFRQEMALVQEGMPPAARAAGLKVLGQAVQPQLGAPALAEDRRAPGHVPRLFQFWTAEGGLSGCARGNSRFALALRTHY